MNTNRHESAPIEAMVGIRILAHCLVNPGTVAVGQGMPAFIRVASCPFVVELNCSG